MRFACRQPLDNVYALILQKIHAKIFVISLKFAKVFPIKCFAVYGILPAIS